MSDGTRRLRSARLRRARSGRPAAAFSPRCTRACGRAPAPPAAGTLPVPALRSTLMAFASVLAPPSAVGAQFNVGRRSPRVPSSEEKTG